MGLLDEPGLDRLLAAGCPACGLKRLLFHSYIDGLVPLLGADPVGQIKWVHDGEKFVDGVYKVSCDECQTEIFSAPEICPRCHSEGGLAAALTTKNRWPVPAECPTCGDDEVRYIAFIPAKVRYHDGRADKPRSQVSLFDPGFHGYRVECKDCGTQAVLADRCPLCEKHAPLRVRPG
jgi:hypothetical protein